MNLGINYTFKQLKPICDTIVTSPTIAKLNELEEVIDQSPGYVLQHLQEYVLFPFLVNLEREDTSIQDIVKQKLLNVLTHILKCTKIQKINLFLQVYTAVAKHITKVNSGTTDENVMLTTVNCLYALFKSLSTDLLTTFYTRQYSIHLPQCVYNCIQIAKNEKMRNLRISAIECLMAICYIHDEADFADVEVRNQVADQLMFFLPGIIIALRDISLDDEKQGHKVTMMAIRALHRIIVLHMKDYEPINTEQFTFVYPPPKTENKEQHIKKSKRDVKEMIERFENDNRSDKWFKDTSTNLQIIVESLIPLQYHYHQKVRYELAEMCHQISINCFTRMSSSLSSCIEILIALSEDEENEISQKCKHALIFVSNKLTNETFLEILEEQLYDTITKLPRVINGTDTAKQLSTLNLFIGYMKLLGPKNLFIILQSSDHLKRLIRCLIHISQLERSNVTLFEEYAIRDFESATENTTWKQFKYINENIILAKLKSALNLISKSEACEIVVDCFCVIFINEFEQRNETVFLLNEILSGKMTDTENQMRIIRNVLRMYMEEENWYLPVSVDNTNYYTVDNISLSDVHSNIIQVCLLVEGIGTMAAALGIQYKTFLFKTLYVVLERAGSAQPCISAAGLTSLLNISKACGYESVTSLIVQNTDYFSFHVIQRMKKIEQNPRVLDVLNIVMKCSTIQVLPSVMDIIDEVLLQSCDKHQENNAVLFLKVFYSFVQNLRRWLGIYPQKQNTIVELLKNYKKQMDSLYIMYGSSFDDEYDEKTGEAMYQADMKKHEELEKECELKEEYKKPTAPQHVKLTAEILQRSLNLLPNKLRDCKLLVLNILTEGVELLAEWQDELLPIVHLIWSPLVDRFKETEDALILIRSFELLIVLARLSKDFIRARTSKQVFPEICDELKKLSAQSYLKDRGSAYRYTQTYKLQIHVLSKLAQLVTDLEMCQEDVDRALDAVSVYLSNKQPIPLQECALTFCKSLAHYEFESVWLHLIKVRGCETADDTDKTNECKKNTESLLKVLQVIHW